MTTPGPPAYDETDAFDLPEWLGETEVTWEARRPLAAGHLAAGDLTAAGHEGLGCDLLAVDDAYPSPVAGDALRVRAHQLWRHGEVLISSEGGRLTLVVPGSRIDTDLALEAVARLSRSVGARPGSYAVRLRVGTER